MGRRTKGTIMAKFLLLAFPLALAAVTQETYSTSDCSGTPDDSMELTDSMLDLDCASGYNYQCTGDKIAIEYYANADCSDGDLPACDTSSLTTIPSGCSIVFTLGQCTTLYEMDLGGLKAGAYLKFTGTCPPSDVPCFSKDSHALDVNGEAVAMASLRSGDYVMDGPDSFTRVIVNQHAAVTVKSPLLEINAGAADISLTPDHVLEVDGKMAAARTVALGSKLGDLEVSRVTSTSGAVINPLTESGKILTQGGILASTYPEWIAEYMHSSSLFPLPVSLSNMLSYLFPEATQNYYDAVIEDFVNRHHPMHLKAALPQALLPVAFLLGDLAVAAGFMGFNLASPQGLCAIAAILCTAAAIKANKK